MARTRLETRESEHPVRPLSVQAERKILSGISGGRAREGCQSHCGGGGGGE